MHPHLSETPCPQPDALRRYIEGEGPSDDLESMDAHISHCFHCQKQLEQLGHPSDFMSRLISEAAQSPPIELPSALERALERIRKDPVSVNGPRNRPAHDSQELVQIRDYRILESVLRSQLDSQLHDRLNLLERYAHTAIELSETELEQATSTSNKQASIRRAIVALRNWEKASLDRDEVNKPDASKSLSAVCLRLKWEERLVQELIKQKTKPLSSPAVQSPPVSTTPPRTIVVEPAGSYYYPTQPVYQYPRTYRSR